MIQLKYRLKHDLHSIRGENSLQMLLFRIFFFFSPLNRKSKSRKRRECQVEEKKKKMLAISN